MQRRTPSPNTQSGASVKIRAVFNVLSKLFFGFYARVSYKQRRSKTRTPTRHRRIITPRSGLGTVSVRLVFWKAEIQARTSVPLSGTCRSRRERPPVRAFYTGRFIQPELRVGRLRLITFSKKALSKLRKESRPRAAGLQCFTSQGAGTQHPIHFS